MSNFKLLFQNSAYSVSKKCALIFLFLGMGWSLWAQQPIITVRFANPQYNCNTGEYCLDVEFQSNTANQSLFGMNVRFFYDDSVLEFVNFRDFQGGYSAVAPNPPVINTANAGSGGALFNMIGAAEFVNGAVQLTNESVPAIVISTTGWTKLFQMCFTVDNAGANPGNFCPSIVWDLISPTSGPGFLTGDDGVVITVVDPSPMFDSAPAIENVVQFNWNDDPNGATMPFGSPSPTACLSTICTGNLVVTKKDSLELGPNGTLEAGDIISYKIKVTNNGNVAVSNVTITDPNADAGSLSCPATTLAPGESMNCTATHTITQNDITNGSVTNTATVAGVSNGNNISDPSDDPDDPTNVDPDNDGDPDDPTTTLLPTAQPVITTRFSNPQYDCQTSQYCLDVEYKSNTPGQSLFGSNVRFWYDDSKLEFVGFSDFQGGYGPFSPNPPTVTTFSAGVGSAFSFTGMPEFVNGAVQLIDTNAQPIFLSTTGWTKIFKACFTVDDLSTPNSFCPAVIWDLEENPTDGGFITGSDGVVITVVSSNPNLDSDPAVENVEQFNWAYDGIAGTPYGAPQQTSCISLQCCIVPIETVLNASICQGTSYSFNGQTLTTAGTYKDTLTAANGCDSVVTLNLTLKPTKATTLNEAICQGASFSFNGQTLATAGTYTATLTAANGCDSVVTLNLTVKPTKATTLNESICAGASFSFNGQTYTTAGTYTATLTAANGCDSVVTLNLTVKPTKATTLNEAICQGASYSFNGQTLTTAGTYTATLTAANGCDSVVTLNLQVKPTKATTLNESICAGGNYSFNGQTLTAAGTYTATLTAANGCDSVVTLNLQVAPEIRKTLNESICQGESYAFNGQTLTAAGTYTATFTAQGGCDSIVTLNLTVKPTKATTLNEAICAGDSYSFNGQTLTAAGTYTATLTAANGCDSIVTLNLQVKPIATTTLNETICAGDSYSFNGQTLTTAGTYTATLTAANGCDSVVTLNLTIQPRATVEAGTPKVVLVGCLGAGSGSVTLTGSSIGGSASSATWTITNQPVGGDGALSGAGPDANPADAIFSASVPGLYTLTLTTNDPAGPCPTVSDQLTITVTNTGNQKVECLACMSQVRVSLDQNCRFLVKPEHVLEGFRDCPNGNLLKDALEVLISDGNNDSYVDCAGTYDYIVQVKKEYQGCIEFASCWGKITAEDKSGPKFICADWVTDTLDCFDVNYVLNNHQTIGKVGATSSPRPSALSNQTILNAEGVSGAGACGLVPPVLVNDNVKNLGYTFFADACQACGCRTTVKWSDRVVYYNCEQMKTNGGIYARIYRSWVATDCNGMVNDTVQEINFKRPAIEDFSFNGGGEGKYDRVVTYNACTPDKNLIKKEDVTPFVCSYFNTDKNARCLFIDQVECNYSVQIKDTEFPICNGKGLKIDREMYIFDWCAGGIIDTLHILIKIGDFEAPSLEFAHHAPNALSTGPMDCTAAFPISVAGIKSTFGVAVTDNCGVANVSVRVKTKDRYVKGILVAPNTWEQVEYAVMNGMMTGLPIGRHRLIIDAYDGCYNAKRDSFEFEVVDKIAPVMKCDDDLHVTLSNANGYTNGYAQVNAADIDEGSWDNCKLAWVRVRRNVPANCTASFIAKGYDSNGNGKLDPMPADGDWTKADGFDINGDGDLADFGETFILKEGKLMTPLQDIVEFFCCDLSERVTIELWGEDTSGNRNFCWNDLLLEDKVTPTCIAPWDVTIYCDDKNLATIDDRTASSAIWGDVRVSSGDDCAALNIEYRTVKSLKCGAGYIDRIWTLTKQTVKGPITITCTQRIKILPVREYNICFPKDISTDCKTPIIDTVIIDELGCDILAVNVTDKRYDASDDECYKIFRTYSVINWCSYDDRCGDPLEQTNISIIDRAVFGNYGKAPIYLLVRDRENNRRDGIEEFYISKDLVHANADDIRVYPPYCTVAEEFYHSFIYTQIIKVYDEERPVVTGKRDTFCTSPTACTASITKIVTIKDNCTDKVELERQMLMIAPFQTLNAGSMILYSTPRWSVKDLTGGQFEITVSNLPEGLHDLIVVGRDECGNLSLPTRIPFVVKDCKAPAPICINGLSTELMPDGTGGGMMAVWAKDFVASPIYDCNGQGPETKDGLKVITKYSINRVGEKADPVKTSLTLTCADAGKLILVELHAWDEKGNHDFCVTYVEVQDNRKVCGSNATLGEISGVITTDDLKPVLGVNVDLSGGAQMNQNTGSNGVYLFSNLTKGSDYTVSPQLDKDHINGVSTFDLVFIQKHILGTKAIDNPYRMIAADVNNSKSISTLDMILIRKLILNIDTKFGNVPSWKFVDASYQFPDPSNPWSAQFPEVVNVNDLEGKVKADFIAVKMGDVSGNASTSGAVAVETRSDKAMIISTDEQQLQKGENYTIVFKAKDLPKIQGYQFTLSIDPSLATIEGIDYTGVMKADNFGIFTQNGMITTSFVRAPLAGAQTLADAGAPVAGQPQGLPLRGDEILFTLKLKAESNTALSRALILNSRLTNMEAYNQSDEVMGVQLAFGSEAVAERAALRQNVPNPFFEETVVSFYLTQAAKAVLTIRDVKGALIYRVEGNYAKGNNQLVLKQEQLKASGVLYYTLETMDFTDTKKMVLFQR